MDNNEFTSREFWLNYWKQKMDRNEIGSIGDNYLFSDVLISNAQQVPGKTVIEIGGFPGTFSLFLKRKAGIAPAIFDYIVHHDFLKKFLQSNGFAENDLNVLEGNIQNYVPEEQFGMVFSVGLIEHFENTEDIIRKHLPFCKPGGRLLIILPNFTGLNGWVNKTFDLSNYQAHNINSMNLGLLRKIAHDMGLEEPAVYFHGKFGLWLENYATRSLFTKLFFRWLWVMGKVFTRMVPVESKFLSPYIILEGRKPLETA